MDQTKFDARCTRHLGYPKVGTRVRITRPGSDMERGELRRGPDRIYTILRYAQPHGFAVIREAGLSVAPLHVHPESLTVVPGTGPEGN